MKTKIIAEATIPARLTHRNISRCFRFFGRTFTEGFICKADPIEAVKIVGLYFNVFGSRIYEDFFTVTNNLQTIWC